MDTSNPHTVLIIGNYRQTITLVRSLAAQNHRIIVGISEKSSSFAEYSKYVDTVWHHPDVYPKTQKFLDALTLYLYSNADIDCIFPVGEHALDTFSNIYFQIPEYVKVIMPAPETIRTCLNKLHMYDIATELDIPQVPYAAVNSFKDLKVVTNEIGYPCVVKPINSRIQLNGEKAVICKDESTIEKYFSEWPVKYSTLTVHEFLDGVRHNVYFTAQEGIIHQRLEVKILRTDSLDGTGSAVEGVTIVNTPQIKAYCDQLIDYLHYSGIGCIQFIVSKDQISFLEINPRLGANFAIACQAGFDIPSEALNLAFSSHKASEDNCSYKIGLRYARILGDLEGIKLTLHKNKPYKLKQMVHWLWRMVISVTAPVHITWSWKDPKPSLFLFVKLLPKTIRRRIKFKKFALQHQNLSPSGKLN